MTTPRTIVLAKALWDGHTSTPDAGAAIDGERFTHVGTRDELLGRSLATDTILEFPEATLMPGLMDMHLHLGDDGWMAPLLLANGVASVRDTGNNHVALTKLRERQQRSDWVGPRIYLFGPLIDGNPPHWAHIARPVSDGDDVAAVVDELAAAGVDGLKVYVRLGAEMVAEVVSRARSHGLPVACHAGACSATEALAAGVGCIEHVFCLDVREDEQTWSDVDPSSRMLRQMADALLGAGAWFCPTLGVMEAVLHWWGKAFERFPGYDELPPSHVDWCRRLGDVAALDEAEVAASEEDFRGQQMVVSALHEAGVPMLAGSDSPFVPVGLGLHYELELLVACGIPNDAALRMATVDGAAYLGISDSVGAIGPGYVADMVAVRGDPLSDIQATRNVEAVWQGGAQLDIDALRSAAHRVADALDRVPPGDVPPFGIPLAGTADCEPEPS